MTPNRQHLIDLNVATWMLNILAPKSTRTLKTLARRTRAAVISEIRERAGGLGGRGWGSLLGRMLSDEVASILRARKQEAERRRREKSPPGPVGVPSPRPDGGDGVATEYTVLIKIVPVEGGPAVWTRIVIESESTLSDSQLNAEIARVVDVRDFSADSQRKLRTGSSYVLVERQIVSVRT